MRAEHLRRENVPSTTQTLPTRLTKREIANNNERRRMQSINIGFGRLRELIPHANKERMSKAAILERSAAHISVMRTQLDNTQKSLNQIYYLFNDLCNYLTYVNKIKDAKTYRLLSELLKEIQIAHSYVCLSEDSWEHDKTLSTDNEDSKVSSHESEDKVQPWQLEKLARLSYENKLDAPVDLLSSNVSHQLDCSCKIINSVPSVPKVTEQMSTIPDSATVNRTFIPGDHSHRISNNPTAGSDLSNQDDGKFYAILAAVALLDGMDVFNNLPSSFK